MRHARPRRQGAAASAGLAALLAGILAFSWWASGQHPFRPGAYLGCAIPIGLVLAALLASAARRTPPAAAGARIPRLGAVVLLALLAAGAALEAGALAAGGRSHDLPTLSTVADELTATHLARFVAFLLWLVAGAALARAGRRPRRPRREAP